MTDLDTTRSGPSTEDRRRLPFEAAVDEGMAEEMARDERVIILGTDPPDDLRARFGSARVRRTPISETAFTGLAVGAAMCGMRPVVWWRNAAFALVAFDQVANQVAMARYMSGGQVTLPMVMRANSGGGLRLAAQHSQSPYAIFAHQPGLRVIAPSNAFDAKGMIKSAIRDQNPVVTFEAAALAGVTGEVGGPDDLVPLGVGRIERHGTDVTVVAIARMVGVAARAAETLQSHGVSVEIIDPRSIVPLDMDLILASVARTGRLVVVDEAPAMCSVASEIVARVAEHPEGRLALTTPPLRVCGLPAPVPYSPPLEDAVLPGVERVTAEVLAVATGRPAAEPV